MLIHDADAVSAYSVLGIYVFLWFRSDIVVQYAILSTASQSLLLLAISNS